MSEPKPVVGIIMGSQSDWTTLRHAAETLDALGVTASSDGASAGVKSSRTANDATPAGPAAADSSPEIGSSFDADIAATPDRARARRGRKSHAPNQLVMSFLAPPSSAGDAWQADSA